MRALHLLVLVVTLAAACAHAPEAAPRASPSPPIVWPRPPAEPRVRLVGSVAVVRPPDRSRWWKTALRVLAGAPRQGSEADVLARPFDVALRRDGSFVVADPDRPGVVAYGADGAFVTELTCANHPWSAPMAVAARGDEVWIADAAASSIVRWTPSGCRVLAPAGLQRPTGLALTDGTIVVSDPPAHQLVTISFDGAVLSRVGERGGSEGQFNFPTDVAAASDGSVYVVDALNFRIVHLGPGGEWLGTLGSRGESGSALARPKGIDVDASGLLYVTDAQRDVLLVFRPDGALEYVVGEPGAGPGQFAHPAGLAARAGRIVVADSVNRRAAIFEVVGGPR